MGFQVQRNVKLVKGNVLRDGLEDQSVQSEEILTKYCLLEDS